MAELNANDEVDINENYHPFHGEEQAGNDMQDQGGGMEEHAGGIEEHAGNMEQDLEDHDGNIEHAGNIWDQPSQETFAVTPSTIEIVQDDMEHTQAHPHAPRPVHPPIQMSHRDKCLLALMVEDRHEVLLRLWRELDKMEHLLGLEHI
ncbi:uncharacterized protein HD556DRAFT_1306605 [Suillus plorans]|uniref:Uncharacterized protein n=1 Tax=Suillus plorans TaxID=116603 RepID=A0A9P7DL53_9AGAM|nr:uncharacterized protein HD556DRAFT_1306605 [Suillus plorans]KAG1797471.1 hypothetical protein HD556DRAFT_1306605 [Suillus plorans]